MIPGTTEHIGDGAYLHFDGFGYELRANHHEHPTDRVYIDGRCVRTLIRLLKESIEAPDPYNTGDGTSGEFQQHFM